MAVWEAGSRAGIQLLSEKMALQLHDNNQGQEKIIARGKTSTGWFYGFKLHLIVNDQGELITFHLTPGNVDDRQPVPHMAKELLRKLFGDKGYNLFIQGGIHHEHNQ